jgi:Ca-activated chloride channel family protein
MSTITALALAAVIAGIGGGAGTSFDGDTTRAQAQATPPPVFKGGVDLVMVTVLVQDAHGRPVSDLTRDDFQVFDAGVRRNIAEFRTGAAPINVALLFDLSGSMDIGTKLDDARAAARQILSQLEPGRDQAALFGFDTRLLDLVPLTTSLDDVSRGLDRLKPFGATSMYDAIAATGRRLAQQPGPRRAIVVLTDGADTSSHLSPPDVATIVSATDVPVYVLGVVPSIDRQTTNDATDPALSAFRAGPLGALARATGGWLFVTSARGNTTMAASQIVDELRHQYVIGFEPGAESGWHTLSVVARDTRLVVRTRSGYVAGGRADAHHR